MIYLETLKLSGDIKDALQEGRPARVKAALTPLAALTPRASARCTSVIRLASAARMLLLQQIQLRWKMITRDQCDPAGSEIGFFTQEADKSPETCSVNFGMLRVS